MNNKDGVCLDSMIVAVKDQVSANLDGEATILHLKKGFYYGLNEVGTRIWERIQEPRRVAEICDFIAVEYGISADRCREDLVALFRELLSENLIQVK